MFSVLVRIGSIGCALIGAVCLVLMMMQIVIDVAASYLFNLPIEGNLEIVSNYYMTAVVFLPLAMVEWRREHIVVDLLTRFLPKRIENYIYACNCLISAGFAGLLAWQTGLDAVSATTRGDFLMGSALVVTWPGRWTLPLGFGFMTLACMLNALRALQTSTGSERK